MATKIWNNTQIQVKDPMINTFSPNKLKVFLFDFYLNLYQTRLHSFFWHIVMYDRFFWHIVMDGVSFDRLFLIAFIFFLYCQTNDCKGLLVV